MRYYCTRDKNNLVSFKTAVMDGLSKDGGLFMPEEIPTLPQSFTGDIKNISFEEIGFEIARRFIGDEIELYELKSIINEAINFPAPLVELSNDLSVLELFHGPTLAFKDFGARFMAKTMGHFVKGSNKELNILVATSGDTGSAVAYGFYGVEGINVYLLYPSGKVSEIQEKQLTTLDKNITSLEIDGTFDDCQRLVKAAFVDNEVTAKLNLSSANSINIARLIPQSFYYVNAYRQIKDKNKPVIVSIPSGNLGNLTAALFAKKMGIPFAKYIGATNSNDVFTEYMNTGNFNPRKSVLTLSNAMDVGNPSNLERIIELYNNDVEAVRADIHSTSYNDDDTKKGIKEVFEKYNYVIEPHGAVGYDAYTNYVRENNLKGVNGIIVETAHPAKFKDVVEETINRKVEIPERLAVCLSKEKKTIKLDSRFESFKDLLLNL
jgi:threonine synthase